MAVRTRTKRAATRKSTTRTRSTRPATARRTTKASRKRRAATSKRGPGGLGQKVQPDNVLAPVVGANPVARTLLVKKFWDYVKARGLQDKKDRRKINSDEKLRPLFGGKRQVSMFEVTRLLARHAH